MPKLQIYNAGNISRTALPTGNASGSIAAGFAAADFGKSTQALAVAIDRKDFRDALFANEQIVQRGRSQWTQWLADAEQNSKPGAPGFTANFSKAYDQWSEETLNGQENDGARQSLTADLEGMRATFLNSAIGYQTAASAAHKVAATNELLTNNLNAVRSDPSQSADALAQGLRVVEGLAIPGNHKENMNLQYREGIAFAEISGRIDRADDLGTIGQLNREIKTSRWTNSLSEAAYANAVRRVEVKMKQLQVRAAQDAVVGFGEDMRELQSGNLNGKWNIPYINSLPVSPAVRERMTKQYESARRIGMQSEWVKSASVEEIGLVAREYQVAIEVTPGDYDAETKELSALLAANDLREAAWQEDQVGYVANVNENAGDALRAFRKDPTPENVANHVAAQTAGVEALYPGDRVKLLPKDLVSQYEQTFASVGASPQSAQQAFDALQDISVTWGKETPLVYAQLAEAGVLDGHLETASRLNNMSVALELLEARAEGVDELIKRVPNPPSKSEVAEWRTTNMYGAQVTFDAQVGGGPKFNQLGESVELLAARRASRNNSDLLGEFPKAFKDLYTADYNELGTLRVPKRYNVDAVEAGLEAFKELVDKKLDVLLPPSAIGLFPEDAEHAAKRVLQENGVFSTSGDESKAVLNWVDRDGGLATAFHREPGTGKILPIADLFETLETLGNDARAQRFKETGGVAKPGLNPVKLPVPEALRVDKP